MKGIRYPQELIDRIIEEIKTSGKSVNQIATENGLNPKTVYTWVRKASNGSGSSQNALILENKKLKKEKQELIQLIGRLSIDVDKLNKKKDQLF